MKKCHISIKLYEEISNNDDENDLFYIQYVTILSIMIHLMLFLH